MNKAVLENHRRTSAEDDTQTADNSTADSTIDIASVVSAFSPPVTVLKDEIQRNETETTIMHDIIEAKEASCDLLERSVQEQQVRVPEIERNADALYQAAVSLKQAADDLQDVSYDGTMIWKIPSFREKMGTLPDERKRSNVERLICRRCPIRAPNIHLFPTFLLFTHRIQDAYSSLPQW